MNYPSQIPAPTAPYFTVEQAQAVAEYAAKRAASLYAKRAGWLWTPWVQEGWNAYSEVENAATSLIDQHDDYEAHEALQVALEALDCDGAWAALNARCAA